MTRTSWKMTWAAAPNTSPPATVPAAAPIDRLVNHKSVKAVASVTLDGCFVVKNLRVVDGDKGLFVSMPQESYPDKDGNKKYSNLFFPITNAAKMDLQNAVLKAYDQHLNQQHDTGQYAHWDSHNDGMMPFGM